MIAFALLDSRPQEAMPTSPYDRWINPGGGTTAEFYRTHFGYLVRFPEQADFEIDRNSFAVRCALVDRVNPVIATTLFRNSILPIIGNHRGDLNMHGSAVGIGETAVAFLGVSRRGKTTLAGAFAKAGYPFLTEDVLALEPSPTGFSIRPSHPELRLFHDSASFLTGGNPGWSDPGEKNRVGASQSLPFRDEALTLGALFILGPGTSDGICLTKLNRAAALAQLIQHSFILDVEDRARLRDHFHRIGGVSDQVACYELDYPRAYDQLPQVIEAIVQLAGTIGCKCEVD